MGLNLTDTKQKLLNVQDMLTEHSINDVILKRNSVVLKSTHKMCNMFNQISDDLRFKGIIRFEYQKWDGEIRRIEGHVCKVDLTPSSADVKLWTNKNEMVRLFFPAVNLVQFYEVFETKEEDNHEF